MEGLFNVVIIFGLVVFCDSFSSKEVNSSLATKTTLTTAKVYDADGLMPKPTSFVETMKVHFEPVEQNSSTPYDLFGVAGPYRRRLSLTDDSLWDWNYWCQLQRKKGICYDGKYRPVERRYYYVAQLNTCKKFDYSGCNANKNNFKTFKDCERNCKDAVRMTIKNVNRKIYCSLQPNAGMCLALIQRFYYDIEAKECKTFFYGGCGGNQNRFDNIELCDERCKKGFLGNN